MSTGAPEILDLGLPTTGLGFHPTLARLRAETPVCRAALPDGSLVWLVTRHDDARTALADPRLSLSKRYAKRWKGFGLPPMLDANLLNMDPPDHTRIRRLVAPAFRARVVQRLRPRVERIAADLLDAVRPREQADLVAAFTEPLPVTVICELLGIPVADRTNLRLWNAKMQTDAPDAKEALDNIVALMLTLIRRKRERPEDDMLSELVAARDQDDRLTEEELTSLAFLIMTAGYEGPANFLGNAALALCQNPEQRDALRAEPSLIDSAVEELLRFDSSEAVAPRRFAVEDLEIGGVPIRAGEPVIIVLSSANRDGEQYPHADALMLDRDPKHLSFGHGVHHCLGSGLARLEAKIALGALVRALPGLRLAVPETELPWLPAFRFRGLTRLPVAWNLE